MDKNNFKLGDWLVEPNRNRITRGESDITLEPLSMDALVFLAQQAPETISIDQLLEALWPGRIVEASTVHRMINKLRHVLGDSSKTPHYIETVLKRGYRIICDVTVVADSTANENTLGIDRNYGTTIPNDSLLDIDNPRSSSTIPRRNRVYWAAASVVALVLLLATQFFVGVNENVQEAATASDDSTLDLATSPPPEHYQQQWRSVAVLPFTNMSDIKDVDFFARGLSEEILNELAQKKVLNVASRTSSFQLAARGLTASELAEKLNVAYILEGSIRGTVDQLRITVQLIRAKDNYHIWSKIYKKNRDDEFNIQSSLAQNISSLMYTEMTTDIKKSYMLSDQSSEYADLDPQAVRYYSDALEQSRASKGHAGNFKRAERLLNKAISYAPESEATVAMYTELIFVYGKLREARELSWAESSHMTNKIFEKIRLIKPDDFGFRVQLVRDALFNKFDYAGAVVMIEQLIEEYPSQFIHFEGLRAQLALTEGRKQEAVKIINAAMGGDASSVDNVSHLTMAAAINGVAENHQEAIRFGKRALNALPEGPRTYPMLRLLAVSSIALGRIEDAEKYIQMAEKVVGTIPPEEKAYFFYLMGDIDAAKKLLANAAYKKNNAYFLARAYYAMGESEKALETIRTGIDAGDLLIYHLIRSCHTFDSMRSDPQFKEMMTRMDANIVHTSVFYREQQLNKSANL